MTSSISIRRVALVVGLTLAWCGLWRSFSFANVLSGLIVSLLIMASGLGPAADGRVRLVPLLRLLWLVFVDLVGSTREVAREILTPTDYTDEGIIAVQIEEDCCDHLLLLAVAITLTPGTAVVDVDPQTGRLYLHLLHIDRREATEEHVHHLARLAAEALPTPNERATA